MNFIVHNNEVVVRPSYGDKLAAAAHGLVMSFGVDTADPSTRTGWTVTGHARLMEDLASQEPTPLESWAPGEKEFYIAIQLEDVSGRRLRTPTE